MWNRLKNLSSNGNALYTTLLVSNKINKISSLPKTLQIENVVRIIHDLIKISTVASIAWAVHATFCVFDKILWSR